MAIFALPVLVFTGHHLAQSIFILSFCSLVQSFTMSYLLKDNIDWKITTRATFFRIAFIPIGIYLLKNITSLSPQHMKQVVGVILLFVIFMQPKRNTLEASKKFQSPYLSYAIFSLSGLMAGTIGIGGPPLILWSLRQGWTPNQIRSFLLSTFCTTLPFTLIILYFNFPSVIEKSLLACFLSLPALFLGVILGVKLNKHISVTQLKRIISSVLVGACLLLIFNA